jgi:uncharacterized protein with HEPN domain
MEPIYFSKEDKDFAKDIFEWAIADLPTQEDLFTKNIKYRKLYLDLLVGWKVLELLRFVKAKANQSAILNELSIYGLKEIVELAKDRSERVAYLNLIEFNKVSEVLYNISKGVLNDITEHLIPKSRAKILETVGEASMKLNKRDDS